MGFLVAEAGSRAEGGGSALDSACDTGAETTSRGVGVRNRYPFPRLYEAYEDSIGVSTPAVIHALNEAAERWPHQWIIDAIRLAGTQDEPSWRFAQWALRRREREEPLPPAV